MNERDQHFVADFGHEERSITIAGIKLAHAAPLGLHLRIEPGEAQLDAPLFAVRIVHIGDDGFNDAVEPLVGCAGARDVTHCVPPSEMERTSNSVVYPDPPSE